MGVVIGVVNTKGGVGKTTVASALANEFSRRGFKTLVIDYDSQSSLTYLVGLNPSDFAGTEHDVTNVFREERVVPVEVKENLYLIPSNEKLKEFAESGKSGKEYYLRLAVKGDEFEGEKGLAEDFDIVIIDSEGGGGTLENSVEIASDYVLIPLRPTLLDETGTLKTLSNLLRNIKIFSLKDLQLLGFIAVDFDKRAKEPMERYAAQKIEIPQVLEKFPFLKTPVSLSRLFLPELYRRTVWTKAAAKNMFIHDYIEKYETYSNDVLLALKEIGDQILSRVNLSEISLKTVEV